MSDLRKIAEMALEALEKIHESCGFVKEEIGIHKDAKDLATEVRKDCNKYMKALHQELAQPEEKMRIEGNGKLTTKPYPNGYESEHEFKKALAQREWVEITKGECDELFRSASDHIEYAYAIEAKLKEKNGG